MSSIKSYILLCLLCLSSHACYARHLGAQVYKKKIEDNLVKVSVLPSAQTSLSKKDEVDVQRTSVKLNMDDEENYKNFDANLKSEPLVSVSWRLPHKKRDEQQPGFNLDYEPPQTHPGVHN